MRPELTRRQRKTRPSFFIITMGAGGIKKPALKRRRLTGALNTSTVELGRPILSLPIDDFSPSTKPPTCSSCHRTFVKPSQVHQCERCRSPTCTICSRICTACPPSLPPTPALTTSSTPTVSPSPSPKRSALTLNTNTANANGAYAPQTLSPFASSRRRKLPTWDTGDDERVASEGTEKPGKEDLLPGCGRIICRNCCFESPQSNTTTCYDCYGDPYGIQD